MNDLCEPETGCLGDFNFDGTVGPFDLGVLLGSWGNPGCSGSTPCPADLNGDGVVGPADMGMLLGNWGPCYGAGGESLMEPPGGALDEETIAAWIEFLNELGHHELAELIEALLNGS